MAYFCLPTKLLGPVVDLDLLGNLAPSMDSCLLERFGVSTTKRTLLLGGVVILHQVDTIVESTSPSGDLLVTMVVSLPVGRG